MAAAAIYAYIKDKTRQDGICEEYSRHFMTALLTVGTIITSINWHSDKAYCILPEKDGLTTEFVSDACWTQGFYTYKIKERSDIVLAYQGIPKHLNDVKVKKYDVEEVYVQYQYMPFFIAALAILYFAPHIINKVVNNDLLALKEKINDFDSETILENFFDFNSNSEWKMRSRVFGNLLVRILYICSNVGSYIAINRILNGKYMDFKWIWKTWITFDTSKNNIYDIENKDYEDGVTLLPTFGICEIRHVTATRGASTHDDVKVVCEISQHVLYHYIFIFLWFFILAGVFISIVGLVLQCITYCKNLGGFIRQSERAKGMYALTFREFEYLEYIRRQNVSFYHKIRSGVMKERIGTAASPQQLETSSGIPPSYGLSAESEEMLPPIKYYYSYGL